jgi:FtsP/CotA-like multicopper oxidase with cupredoxin domain
MRTAINRFVVLAAGVVMSMVVAACSGGGDARAGGGTGDRAAPATIDVSLTEFKITPAMIDAPAGQDLTFDVTNDGGAPHTFAVDTGSGTRATPQIQPGSSTTLTVPALTAGDYRFYCTIAGHADLGMEGTLMVGSDGTVAAAATGPSGSSGSMGSMTAQEMADSHQAGVKAFPAETQGQGNRILKPTMDGDVKVFELTADEVRWETSPGQFVEAMGYNGQIPGPEIHVQQGDHIRVVVKNELAQPTVVHFHGVTVPNDMDGVPYITQDPIMPGGFFTYEFTVVDPPGMYVYHSHFNSTEQVGEGLYGAFYVDPKAGDWSSLYGEPVDVTSTLFLGDGPLGYVLNGKGFPATSPIVAKQGDGVLIHLANDGSMIHPMHLHGYHFEVVAEDGFVLPQNQRYMADTLMIAPGQRFDVYVDAKYPGVWAFHCHILPHVEGPQGMFGMVTALVVQ